MRLHHPAVPHARDRIVVVDLARRAIAHGVVAARRHAMASMLVALLLVALPRCMTEVHAREARISPFVNAQTISLVRVTSDGVRFRLANTQPLRRDPVSDDEQLRALVAARLRECHPRFAAGPEDASSVPVQLQVRAVDESARVGNRSSPWTTVQVRFTIGTPPAADVLDVAVDVVGRVESMRALADRSASDIADALGAHVARRTGHGDDALPRGCNDSQPQW